MLDPSFIKQTKNIQSLKAKLAKSEQDFVLSDEAKVGGKPWSVLKHNVVKPEFDFYKFWVSEILFSDLADCTICLSLSSHLKR